MLRRWSIFLGLDVSKWKAYGNIIANLSGLTDDSVYPEGVVVLFAV